MELYGQLAEMKMSIPGLAYKCCVFAIIYDYNNNYDNDYTISFIFHS